MEFVEALQEFLFHQGFQKIKYDSKILWGKDTGDKLSLLEVVPPLLPGQPRVGLKQREEEMLDIERQIMLKYQKKVEHLLLILNKGEPDFEERTELRRMLTPVNTILVLANVVVFMILSFLGNTTDAEFMAAHGAMDWMDVVEKHQYYRLFTSMFLHFGADHLLQNMLILLVIGCRLERITGKLSYLLIYIGAGLTGAGTSIIFTLGNNPNTVSAGASGAIFGVMGGLLYCIISDIIQKKRHHVEEIGLTGMIFMVASALSYGFFSTGIDNAAHIGGLVGGFLITMISRFVI